MSRSEHRLQARPDHPSLVSLDIETTGLDPDRSEVRAVGLAADHWSAVLVGEDEPTLLRSLESLIANLGSGSVLVTWNGEEFDLPFLGRRFDICEVPTTLVVTPKHGIGKYGNPLFDATWGHRRHIDIAPHYKDTASSRGVPWSLKPVARAALGVTPIEVDREGSRIAEMSNKDLRAYVASDAEITRELAQRALPDLLVPVA